LNKICPDGSLRAAEHADKISSGTVEQKTGGECPEVGRSDENEIAPRGASNAIVSGLISIPAAYDDRWLLVLDAT
jgi:hypothetical protein